MHKQDRIVLKNNERNFRQAARSSKPYQLLMGSCYVDSIAKRTGNNWCICRMINVKHGISQILQYEQLVPTHVLFVTSWANAMAILNKEQIVVHPPLWRKILTSIDKIGAPILMIDMPAAFHRYKFHIEKIDRFVIRAYKRRERYKSEVIHLKHRNHITYIDLMDSIDHKYCDINENRNNSITKSPWHVGRYTIKHTIEAYRRFVEGCLDLNYFDCLKKSYGTKH